jgi:hypothetical protein
MTRALGAAMGLFVIGLAVAAPAAESASRVALVRTASNDPLLREATTRLRAELADSGFDVVEVDRAPADPRRQVEDAGGGGSFATVAMTRAGEGALADVWISDHVTGKTVVRRLRVGRAPNAAAVLAIRALELLRASLLEVTVPGKTKGEPEDASEAGPTSRAPSDVLEWMRPARVREPPFSGTSLAIGATGLTSFDGVGLAIGPTLRLSQGLFRGWFTRLDLAGPLVGADVGRAEGSASVRQEFAAAEFGFRTRGQPIGAFAWAGIGAFDLHTTGSASNGYRSRSQGVVSFLSTAGVGGYAELVSRVAFSAEISAISLVPQPVVIIAGNAAGKVGAPSFALSLGLTVRL